MKKILLIIILLLNFSMIICPEIGIASINVKAGLNMRDMPSLKGNKIGLIPFKERVLILDFSNEKVEINGIKSSWYYVKWNGKEGWVFGGYLDFISEEEYIETIMYEILGYFPIEWIELTYYNGQYVVYKPCEAATKKITIDIMNYPYPKLIFLRGQDADVYQITAIRSGQEFADKEELLEEQYGQYYFFTLALEYSDKSIEVTFYTEDSFKTGEWKNLTKYDVIYTVNSEFNDNFEVVQEDCEEYQEEYEEYEEYFEENYQEE